MANISRYYQDGLAIDHTPGSAIYAGNLVNLGSLAGFTPRDVAASAKGALRVQGVLEVPWTGEVASIGDNVWWDANGTPYGGSADGACTSKASSVSANLAAKTDWWVGTLIAATVANDAVAYVAMNQANPNIPAWQNKLHQTTAADKTLTAADDSGMVTHVTADAGFDTEITLPTGVVGMEFIIQNDEADGINGMIVDLDGNEIIEGGNLTIAATKEAINTLATSKRGDFLHLVCNVAATSWRCLGIRGVWATS